MSEPGHYFPPTSNAGIYCCTFCGLVTNRRLNEGCPSRVTPPGSVQMSTNEDIHPMSTNEDIHELVDRKCTCGWEPALGTSIYRSFDLHLLEVRGG